MEDLDAEPLRTDTLIRIEPTTFEEKILFEKIYIDEVHYRFQKRDKITTPKDASIPKRKSITKGNRKITYFLVDDCYMIHSVLLLEPKDID